jgi:hypothetical protein
LPNARWWVPKKLVSSVKDKISKTISKIGEYLFN